MLSEGLRTTQTRPMWGQLCSGTALTANVGGSREGLQDRPRTSLGAPRDERQPCPWSLHRILLPAHSLPSCLLQASERGSKHCDQGCLGDLFACRASSRGDLWWSLGGRWFFLRGEAAAASSVFGMKVQLSWLFPSHYLPLWFSYCVISEK